MADTTGPISTLPGHGHSVPTGAKCDRHPDRDAVARIQGETDSFGCEMIDMCQACLDHERAYRKSDAAKAERCGQCEWCKKQATDLRHARDYDEGMHGPVYRVCGACVKKQNDAAQAYNDDWDDRFGDYGD